MEHLDKYLAAIDRTDVIKVVGKVVQVVGLVVEAQVQGVFIGELCIITIDEKKTIRAEVVGFKEEKVLLMPLGPMSGIRPGARIYATGSPIQVKVGPALLGRVLNGIGEPMDRKGDLEYEALYEIDRDPPDPILRPRIDTILKVGVKAIDGILTFGKGQRIGIFAGSGVGKSTLMGMLARNCEADVNVISLVGERGREVKDFIEESLGEEGLKRSVVVVATSDVPPVIRLKGAMVGTAIA